MGLLATTGLGVGAGCDVDDAIDFIDGAGFEGVSTVRFVDAAILLSVVMTESSDVVTGLMDGLTF